MRGLTGNVRSSLAVPCGIEAATAARFLEKGSAVCILDHDSDWSNL
jgi:hypothetical protein